MCHKVIISAARTPFIITYQTNLKLLWDLLRTELPLVDTLQTHILDAIFNFFL